MWFSWSLKSKRSASWLLSNLLFSWYFATALYNSNYVQRLFLKKTLMDFHTFTSSSYQLAVWSCASQRGAPCHSPHPRLLPVNFDLWPLYSQVQYYHDIWPLTENNMNEEGEHGSWGAGATQQCTLYIHTKTYFKHLAKTKSVCRWMDQKVCAIITLQYSLLRTCIENLSLQWC